eukprot:CAMPEP_0177624198 /NCGR_PEP_ID=MMETSP0419_2-20121207/29351_1 /TAXON_ID=582737 /ORGANISM="Tetraselmis sp., Strain GSL018" /LENGTH=143 /DNA_ID=CAMNT_0019124887 /DNA_START=361 /DNA_END=794 /DNA_ORIENTATION=+
MIGANLSGTLPAQWSALTGLSSMSLISSGLLGELPPQWSTLAGLSHMGLAETRFQGHSRLSGARLQDSVKCRALSSDVAATGALKLITVASRFVHAPLFHSFMRATPVVVMWAEFVPSPPQAPVQQCANGGSAVSVEHIDGAG